MLNTTSASLAKVLTSANSWRTPSNFFGKISSTNSSIKAKATSDLALISRAVEFSSTPISLATTVPSNTTIKYVYNY